MRTRRPRLSRSRCATCRPGPRESSAPRHHRASARPACAGDLDPRQLRLRRAARRALRPAVCVRLLLHRRAGRRAGARAVPAALPAERAPSAAAGDDLRLGAGRRHRDGGAAPRAVARALARRPRARHLRAAAGARRDRRARLQRGRDGDDRGDAREGVRRHRRRGRRARCARWRAALELDELVVNTWAHEPAARRRSYALLAREFGLAGAGSDAAR